MHSLKRARLEEKDKEREQIIQRLSSEIQEQISLRHKKEDELSKQAEQMKQMEAELNGRKEKSDEYVKSIENQNQQEVEKLNC